MIESEIEILLFMVLCRPPGLDPDFMVLHSFLDLLIDFIDLSIDLSLLQSTQ